MANSQSDLKTFSVRIVSMDYYMSPPIPGLDISYSSFQGGKVNEVPVIRVYGSTPAGQKTCLHIHGALPYFYVPCSDLFLQPDQEGEECTRGISHALEKALKLKGNVASKRQHVHSCSLVRAKKFYGYHSSEELFVKIYLYYPQDVSRAANLLLGGAVLDRVLQPHESHIPFLLQFMVDYNLYGMGHLHVSKMKFRYPVPDTFSPRKSNHNEPKRTIMDIPANTSADFQADSGYDPYSDPPIWISSTIPDGWVWLYSSQDDSSSDQALPAMKRSSTSALEGDAVLDAILNQQFLSYTSLSQKCSKVRMIQSLIPIWEEFERNGMHELVLPPDPGKPLPGDVLRILSNGIGFEDIFLEPDNVTALCFHSQSINSSTEEGKPFQDDDLGKSNEKTNAYPSQLSTECLEISNNIQSSSGVKVSDHDALGILNWLASSQAAEDINSDDDLARETILSPLMPSTTLDKVLEKAHVDYENESQQECEDILDTVQDRANIEGFDGRAADLIDSNHSCETSSYRMIPQVDGSSDSFDAFSCAGKSHHESGAPSGTDSWHDAHLAMISNRKKRRQKWGSLPVSSGQRTNDLSPSTALSTISRCGNHIKDDSGLPNSVGSGANLSPSIVKGSTKEIMINCSMRDLMRKKRYYHAEPSECRTQIKKSPSVEEDKGSLYIGQTLDEQYKIPFAYSMNMNSGAIQQRECDETNSCTAFQMHYEPYDAKTDNLANGKLPIYSGDCNTLPRDSSNVEPCHSFEGSDVRGVSEAGVDLQNSGFSGAPLLNKKTDPSEQYSHIKSSVCAVQIKHCASNGCENMDISINSTKPLTTDVVYSEFVPHAQSSELASENKSSGGEKVLRRDAIDSSCLSSSIGGVTFKDGAATCAEVDHLQMTDKTGFTAHKRSNDGIFSQKGAPDELRPFFGMDCLVEGDCYTSRTLDHNQGGLLGVPIHYQNDGSYLFMLTPVFRPPQTKCVERWLTLDSTDVSEENKVVCPALAPSIKESSSEAIGLQNSRALSGSQPLIEAVPASDLKPNLDLINQQHKGSHNMELEHFHDGIKVIPQCKEDMLKCKPSTDFSEDISQISGPDRKSKLTPLSQIGFRDSASIGCGQQLTLLSIEVQAECRGDLRPDPRFDAVSIIVLVIQEDDDPVADSYVLLHCNGAPVQRNLDGLSGCKLLGFSEERHLFTQFVKIFSCIDPDVLMGWDIQGGSLGFLAERAAHLGFDLLNKISRTPSETNATSRCYEEEKLSDLFSESIITDSVLHDDAMIIDDEWGRTHASGIHVGGRIVLNIWRLMRGEVKLNMYTMETVAEAVLRRKVPSIPSKVLTSWFLSGPGRARFRCIEYILDRAKLNLQIMTQLDMINRTSELARIFGIDFFSVLSRGSQYRVESMFLRLAHTQNYIAISPGNQQVAFQPAMECLPLVMEPESGFYADPVVVLDFQSLYPSMIIAYNLCYSTCLGKVTASESNILGVSSYSPDRNVLQKLKHKILLTPNGVMFVPSEVRKGVLPRLLEELLSTRIMVKQAMKKLAASEKVLHRIFNARQLALKLISNVTYGYTAAGFSGRMPCAEIADSIVQCGRRTLENAISFVNTNDKWKAKVIYGDTDSMFVLLKGRSLKEAFQIGHEIASEVSAMSPNPVTLKMEKVYHPCFLITKKRYVGYSYESPDQSKPIFDAKGIETVRRDSCGAVCKTMERSLRLFFEHHDIEKVKSYLLRQWKRIMSGRVDLQDFVFAKEVRLGTYRARASSLPPAAIVATKAMRIDPRAEPRYAERVPYVVVHGEPGARLSDVVVDPFDLLTIDSPYRVNDMYYIQKQIIPALQRVFGLVGADLNQWLQGMPRPEREAIGKRGVFSPNAQRTRIDYYYLSKHCILCGELVQAFASLCHNCSKNEASVAVALTGRTSKLERDIHHLVAICRHCGGGDWVLESGVKCTSLACSIFYERRKIQKELQSLSAAASEAGFYPGCVVEWF
ncbi:PREDICTED: DNA polymerase zeta catalytic subunit isoform X1 [Ipomoea nil]|uniref:DNA polymerase zeta catalytic subunit isoform X1 n=1 Tax=Ipomoea nil TaxID=35883 RepID=UPI000901B9A7|nr:PREDICTED: DNA polymerase zeta catalytic subunit isoform X1 [Ipomoea nil]